MGLRKQITTRTNGKIGTYETEKNGSRKVNWDKDKHGYTPRVLIQEQSCFITLACLTSLTDKHRFSLLT